MTNLRVSKIEKANKKDYYCVYILFDGNTKEYKYVRKGYKKSNNKAHIVISGVKITFDIKTLKVIDYKEVYETKGYKRQDFSSLTKKIKEEIKQQNLNIVNSEEIKHNKYNQIKACLECNLPIYLAGPAGSGKNYTVEQICRELGWNFYFSNSVQQEYKLTGFIDAGGEYHDTEFYKACTDENDCVFFLDEMDSSIPEVLVLLNAAIANGYFEFPTGKVNLNHVHFIAAGNTVGSGADDLYTGRMVIDQATLDRFVIIDFDYDSNIEMSISNNNSDLVSFVHDLRNFANRCGIRATFSYRCIKAVTKLESTNQISLVDIIKIAVVKGLDNDTISSLAIYGDTKYHNALKEIREAA